MCTFAYYTSFSQLWTLRARASAVIVLLRSDFPDSPPTSKKKKDASNELAAEKLSNELRKKASESSSDLLSSLPSNSRFKRTSERTAVYRERETERKRRNSAAPARTRRVNKQRSETQKAPRRAMGQGCVPSVYTASRDTNYI